MNELFLLIFVTCSLNLGFHISIQESMLLQRVGEWGNHMVEKGNYIFELITCVWCRSSVMVIPSMAILIGLGEIELEWSLAIYYPIVLGASSLISGFIWTIYLFMSETILFLKSNGELARNSGTELQEDFPQPNDTISNKES